MSDLYQELFSTTPIETYVCSGVPVHVKREDMCGPAEAPTFSKIRGLFPHLQALMHYRPDLEVIGYVETSISMAGWGVAWACKELGLRCIIFDPQYKPETELPLLRYHRQQWEKFGVELYPQKAGMARVNWNMARNIMKERYGKRGQLLQLGLPLSESVEATAKQMVWSATGQMKDIGSIVVNVGSGTIAAGVVKGISQLARNDSRYLDIEVHGVMGRTGSKDAKHDAIYMKAGIPPEGSLFDEGRPQLFLHDPGWEYTQKSEAQAPFPCHPYYDRKAWEWLVSNVNKLRQPVLFWNIGR